MSNLGQELTARTMMQAILVIGFMTIMGYMVCTNQQLPAEFWPFMGLVVGYLFGTNNHRVGSAIRDMVSGKEK